MLQESITLLCQWGQSGERGVWSVTVTIHCQDYENPSSWLLPWNKLSVEVLVTWEAQKVELIENWEVFPGEISKWDKIVKCSAFKFPSNSWKPNQHFPFGIGCFLALFSNGKVQVLHCLLRVSLSEKATETTDNQGKQLEEITTFSLIKRNVPHNSSDFWHFWEPVTFSLQEVLSSHCHSHKKLRQVLSFSSWKKQNWRFGEKMKIVKYFAWLLPTSICKLKYREWKFSLVTVSGEIVFNKAPKPEQQQQ